jgi:hypothetical protein
MTEVAKRLPPTFATLRDLFVHSGNQCAFPECDRALVNPKGQWVGEVCHIQAALPGGERFNEAMTNEERRGRANLLLMCHDHHVETDDAIEFPVDRLATIEDGQEAKFAGPPNISDEALEQAVREIVAASIEDQTDRVVLHLPQTLTRFGEVEGLNETPEERRGTIEFLRPRLERLRGIPVDTRAVFAILLDRSRPGHSVELPLHELELATGTSAEDMAPHVEILERYHLAGLEESWRDDRPLHWVLSPFDIDGWDFWSAFRDFCAKQSLPVKEIVNELRFDVLD